MNCKPNQLAWIKVPANMNGSGMEALHNHVVRTVTLVAMRPALWQVDPPQLMQLRAVGIDITGRVYRSGQRLIVEGIPDAWLQPFDPESDPSHEAHHDELEVPA